MRKTKSTGYGPIVACVLAAIASAAPVLASPACGASGCWRINPLATQVDLESGDAWAFFEADLLAAITSCQVGTRWRDGAHRPALRLVDGVGRDSAYQSLMISTVFEDIRLRFSVVASNPANPGGATNCVFQTVTVEPSAE